MKDLNKLVEECKEELDKIGIEYGNVREVTVNTRAKSRWGQCCTEVNATNWCDKVFSINISDRLLADDVSDVATKNTIIHELLHSCEGGMTHKGNWKKLAEKVNYYYPQYNIKRCTTSEEKGIAPTEKEYNYILKCEKCGHEYKHIKMCKSVKHPEWYFCSRCNGTLKRVK